MPSKYSPILETERLRIRPAELADAPALFDYGRRPGVAVLAGFPANQSLDEVEGYIVKQRGENGQRSPLQIFVLELRADQQVIGTINFNQRLSPDTLEMGYVLHPDYWGQGLMPEAARAFLTWGFSELDLHKVELVIYDYNDRSQALARKLGFSKEGRLRDRKKLDMVYHDVLIYGLLKSEWAKKSARQPEGPGNDRNLETERLVLRPWQEADAEDLYRYASSPEVGPAAGWPVHTSVADSREIIRQVLSGPESYALVPKAAGHATGSAGLMTGQASRLALPDTEGEIGYWIGRPFWGQGLVTEAVRELVRHGFEDLGLTKIWAGYFDSNHQSERLLEKCGFTYHHTEEAVPFPLIDAVKTEHIVCLNREEWERRREPKQEKETRDKSKRKGKHFLNLFKRSLPYTDIVYLFVLLSLDLFSQLGPVWKVGYFDWTVSAIAQMGIASFYLIRYRTEIKSIFGNYSGKVQRQNIQLLRLLNAAMMIWWLGFVILRTFMFEKLIIESWSVIIAVGTLISALMILTGLGILGSAVVAILLYIGITLFGYFNIGWWALITTGLALWHYFNSEGFIIFLRRGVKISGDAIPNKLQYAWHRNHILGHLSAFILFITLMLAPYLEERGITSRENRINVFLIFLFATVFLYTLFEIFVLDKKNKQPKTINDVINLPRWQKFLATYMVLRRKALGKNQSPKENLRR